MGAHSSPLELEVVAEVAHLVEVAVSLGEVAAELEGALPMVGVGQDH